MYLAGEKSVVSRVENDGTFDHSHAFLEAGLASIAVRDR